MSVAGQGHPVLRSWVARPCCAARRRAVNIAAADDPAFSTFRGGRVWHHHAMAGRAELVDAIAGFALFADLTGPQLEGIVHLFEEAVFTEGDRSSARA